MNNSHKSGVSSDATDVTKPKRPNTALRALDYRKRTGGRWQRCSRCHAEHELTAPVLYNVGGQQLERSAESVPSLMPLMLGQDLLGFICGKCFYSTCQHVVSIFPDAQGFPHVDRDGMLLPAPRCECGTPLHYSNDGRELLCAQCDGSEPTSDPIVVDGANG